MRAVLVVLAAAVGIVAALAAAVLWTAGHDLFDEGRFTQRTVAALQTPAGREAIAGHVAALVRSETPAIVPTALIDQATGAAVDRVAGQPAFAAVLTPAVEAAHRALLDLSDHPATINLGSVRDVVARELAAIDPRLPALLPAASTARQVTISTGIDAPGVPASALEGKVPQVVALLAVAAAALIGIAVAVAERPALAACGIGIVLALSALVPVVLRFALPAVAGSRVRPPDDALARLLAADLLSGWVAAAVALALAGLTLAAAGLVAIRRHPPRRRPAAR